MFGRSNPDKELKERLKKPITIEVPFKALCSGKPKSEYFTEPPFKYDRVELLIDDKLVISAARPSYQSDWGEPTCDIRRRRTVLRNGRR